MCKRPISLGLATVLMLASGGVARAGWPSLLDAVNPIDERASVTNQITAAAAITEPKVHDVPRNSDGLFYVNATVNGKPMRFLVDTGASVMVLTSADAKALGLMVQHKDFTGTVSTVGGAARMAWTNIDHLQLAGHEMRNVDAAIVSNGLEVSLLGQNILKQFESITISADRLVIR